MALSRNKVSLIHVAKARAGLDDEEYRLILRRAGGVDSAAELDAHGFRMVMDAFAHLGFRSDWRQRNLGSRPGMATAAQVALIRTLWREYTDGQGTEPTLGKWLDRTFKVAALRFVDFETARKAITALRAMCGKRRAA